MSLFITSLEIHEKEFFEKIFLKGIKKDEIPLELPKTPKDENIHLWYFPKSQKNQKLWDSAKKNDWCLFGIDGKYIIAGKFLYKIKNNKLKQNIFPKSVSNQSILIGIFYQLTPISLNFLKTNRKFGFSESLLKMHKIKFLKINNKILQEIENEYGGFEKFLEIKQNILDEKINFPVDAEEPPGHITYSNTRVIRDTVKSEKLKKLYDNRCQICNFELVISKNKKYSEVHHIWPLGEGGMDNIDNMLVLCPNHHTQFDYAVIGFDKKNTSRIVNRQGIKIGKILFKKNHVLNNNNIMHHTEKIERL